MEDKLKQLAKIIKYQQFEIEKEIKDFRFLFFYLLSIADRSIK